LTPFASPRGNPNRTPFFLPSPGTAINTGFGTFSFEDKDSYSYIFSSSSFFFFFPPSPPPSPVQMRHRRKVSKPVCDCLLFIGYRGEQRDCLIVLSPFFPFIASEETLMRGSATLFFLGDSASLCPERLQATCIFSPPFSYRISVAFFASGCWCNGSLRRLDDEGVVFDFHELSFFFFFPSFPPPPPKFEQNQVVRVYTPPFGEHSDQ